MTYLDFMVPRMSQHLVIVALELEHSQPRNVRGLRRCACVCVRACPGIGSRRLLRACPGMGSRRLLRVVLVLTTRQHKLNAAVRMGCNPAIASRTQAGGGYARLGTVRQVCHPCCCTTCHRNDASSQHAGREVPFQPTNRPKKTVCVSNAHANQESRAL